MLHRIGDNALAIENDLVYPPERDPIQKELPGTFVDVAGADRRDNYRDTSNPGDSPPDHIPKGEKGLNYVRLPAAQFLIEGHHSMSGHQLFLANDPDRGATRSHLGLHILVHYIVQAQHPLLVTSLPKSANQIQQRSLSPVPPEAVNYVPDSQGPWVDTWLHHANWAFGIDLCPRKGCPIPAQAGRQRPHLPTPYWRNQLSIINNAQIRFP